MTTMLIEPQETAEAVADLSAGLRLSVLQGTLKRALGIVSRAVASDDTSLPLIFKHILVDASGGRVRLAATNGIFAVVTQLRATIEAEGWVTLPGKLATDMVSKLPSDTLTLALDEVSQVVEVCCTRITTRIQGLDADDFPAIPDPATLGDEPLFVLPPEVLRAIIAHVADAAAKEDSRPSLTGVLLKTAGTMATFAATDGFRLCLHRQMLEVETGERQDFLIPASALLELGKILKEAEADDIVEVLVPDQGNQIVFRIGAILFASRLLSYAYPDVEQILRQCAPVTRTALPTTSLLETINRAALVASENKHVIKLQMTPHDGTAPSQLTLSATADQGSHVEVLEATCEGEGGHVAVNARLLKATVDAFKGDTVVIETASPSAPVVFRREQDTADAGSLAILMPMSGC